MEPRGTTRPIPLLSEGAGGAPRSGSWWFVLPVRLEPRTLAAGVRMPRAPALSLFAALLLAPLGACTENALHSNVKETTPAPRLTVDPARIDFGDVPLSTAATEVVTLANEGDSSLSVS